MKRLKLSKIILMALVAIMAYAPTAQATAWPIQVFDAAHTRGTNMGYFTNRFDNMGLKVFPEGISSNDVTQFLAKIEGEYAGGDTQHKTGAAFIILTMLNINAGTVSIAGAGAFIPQWDALVRQYDSAGRVDYNFNLWYPCGALNTYYQVAENDVAFFDANNTGEPPGSPECDTNRVVIMFTNADGTTYQIKKNCANPIGDFRPLKTLIVPYTITPELTNSVLTVPLHLEPGTNYCNFNAIARANTGPTNAYNMTVTPSGTANVPGNSYSAGLSWPEPIFPGAGVVTQVFCVQISNAAPDGSQICFTNTINPGKEDAAGTLSATSTDKWGLTAVPACLPVFRTRYPAVQGFNGDIHAGGGLCTPETNILALPGSLGYVTGNVNSNSFGQYVVSASAPSTSITNFGSAGSAGSALNLGQAGWYTQACRSDLLAAANTYKSTSTAWTPIIGTPDATWDTSGKSGVWFFAGRDLNISGSVDGSLTIVKTNAAGVVRVIAPGIHRNTGNFGSRTVPSLGVITDGNIVIRAAVINVDAYLFANGTIDTCEEGGAGPTSLCATPVLTINGFLMAHNIFFRRLGPFRTQGAQVAEKITLSAQIYLNPPQLFDFSIDGNLLNGQGEKQPLF
jgi:hypothetical protein